MIKNLKFFNHSSFPRTKLSHRYFVDLRPNFFPFENSFTNFPWIRSWKLSGRIPSNFLFQKRKRKRKRKRRGGKGGFKARVAISGMLGQGGVVIRVGGGGWDTFRGRSISAVVKAPPWAATRSNFSRLKLHFDSRSTVIVAYRCGSFDSFFFFYSECNANSQVKRCNAPTFDVRARKWNWII